MTGKRPPGPSRARLWIAWLGLLGYGAVVLTVTLLPNAGGEGFETGILNLLSHLYSRGVPEWFDFHMLEFGANVAMFIPLGFFVGLLLPWRWQWLGIAVLPAVSTGIEVAQYWFLANRLATLNDIIANSLGGWVGLLGATLIRAAVYARDRRVIARARFNERRR